jgi:asparagine synthase (glutamine-hydrolysing)
VCGIAGIFSYKQDGGPIDVAELIDVREAMASRGPDGRGLWADSDQRIGLAHRRLAIIDLSHAGAQPMKSNDGTLVITYNGELYNYRELRKELIARGHYFTTESDTEVLLALYKEAGEEMVHLLRGMYAFAIWDADARSLFAARDPFGIKPFYYSDNGKILRFASQVKALVRGEGIRLSQDPAGHAGFFIFGYVPEPHTLYRQIRTLPAGASLRVRSGAEPVIMRFYDLSAKIAETAAIQERPVDPREQEEIVAAALRESVRHHLVADVPVGVFLSSGIDSNVIAATARSLSSNQITGVTMGFDEYKGTQEDEVPLAAVQAARLGMEHAVRFIQREDFYANLRNIWSAMDQPSIDGINSWLVAKVAAESGLKVCLSGLGGDELFGGYPGFRQIPRLVQFLSRVRMPRGAASAWRAILRALPERFGSPKYSEVFSLGKTIDGAYLLRRALFLPDELRAFLDPDIIQEGVRQLDLKASIARSTMNIHSPHAAIAALELSWYMRSQLLRDTDWASMAHGLEVRTPFVDVALFEALIPSLLSSRPPTKRVLAKTVKPYLDARILDRPKTGFQTPVRDWFRLHYRQSGRYRGLRAWSRITYSEFVSEVSLLPSDPIPPRLAGSRPIMIYRIGQLGDTLVSLPAIQAVRKRNPTAQLILLTNRHPERKEYVSAWDVVGPSGLCDGVMFYDVFEESLEKWPTYFRLMRKIRSIAPSEVINLSPRVRPSNLWRDRYFFRALCGVPVYKNLPPEEPPTIGAVDSLRSEPEWLRLLFAADDKRESAQFRLRIPRWASQEAQAALSGLPGGTERLIAFSPGSKMPAKRWPAARFAEVGKQILERERDTGIVILGGAEDRELGYILQRGWGPRSVNLAGDVSVFVSAAALTRCAAYIGNDSGAMHLAGVVGIPCVALFSARDAPGKWDPMGSRNWIIRKHVDCAGCMLEICDKQNLCLTKIGVDEVITGWNAVSAPQVH